MSFPEKEFGLPISGDRQTGRSRTEQEGIHLLRPLIQAVLDLEYIHSFGWDQYTPYFNDGDVCEFGINTVWFRTMADVKRKEVPEELEKLYKDGHITQEEFENITGRLPEGNEDDEFSIWEYELYYNHPSIKKGSPAYETCEALSGAVQHGRFYDALEKTFGDHARVKFTKDKITVEEYSHD